MDANTIIGEIWDEFLHLPEIDDLEAVREDLRKPVIDPRVPVEIAWSPRLDSTLTVICGVGPNVGYTVFRLCVRFVVYYSKAM